MSNLIKFVGGLVLGAAIGTGVYMLFTNDSEEGIIHDVKMIANDAISQGKQAAEARRVELENELRQPPAASSFTSNKPDQSIS